MPVWEGAQQVGEARRPALHVCRRNLLGKAFSAIYIIEGQENRVQPFKPIDRFEGFLFLALRYDRVVACRPAGIRVLRLMAAARK
jgi:hypothetical protein